MISKKHFIKPGDIVTFEDRKKANLSNVHVTTNIDVLVSQVNDDHVLVGHTKSSIPFDKIKYINGMTPSRILYTASVAIDMDGVLVDFDKGVMDTFVQKLLHLKISQITVLKQKLKKLEN